MQDGWPRSLLDVLSHSYGHYREPGESARRHALVGFDQAIEVAALGYAGDVRGDPIAARHDFQVRFDLKLNYLAAEITQAGAPFHGSFSGMAYRHRLRNRVYHWPTWWVPEPAEVHAARRDAVAVAEFVTSVTMDHTFPGLGPSAGAPDAFVGSPERITAAEARDLTAAAHDVAQRLDPFRGDEGVHFLEITEALGREGRAVDRSQLYDLLKNHQRRFDAIGNGMFRWKELTDDGAGISGRALAEAAFSWCLRDDPRREGRHYDRQIKAGLIRDGIKIAGWTKTGGTMHAAIAARPDLFERTPGRPGVYRWRGRAEPGS